MIERLLERKIGVGILLVLILGVAIGLVAFGAIVRATSMGSERYGVIGAIALQIASIPKNFRDGLDLVVKGEKKDLVVPEERFGVEAGLAVLSAPGGEAPAEFLLLSRYDGDLRRSVVELVNLSTHDTLHRWLPDFAAINERSSLTSNLVEIRRDRTPSRVRMMHPLLLEDGDLVYQDMSPLVRIGPCGEVRWSVGRLFHHSIERHADGGFWTGLFLEPQTIGGVSKTFKEDAIAHVSADGEVLFEKSVPQLLIDNGLSALVYGLDFYSDDPLHLNDVQEATADTDYWRKGDLFLSLRNISAIVLYRPAANKVIWIKQGPWVNQHDVDILDSHRIAVFNNNRFNYHSRSAVDGANSVMIYDFATNTVSSPYAEAMQAHDIRTISEGRSEILPDGSVFVEESNYGRAMRLTPDGEVIWQYVNRASDGALYLLNWSRVIDPDFARRVAANLKETGCS